MGFSVDAALAFVARGATLELVDARTGAARGTAHLPVDRPDEVIVGPDGRFVVAHDVNGAVRVSAGSGPAVDLAPPGRSWAVSATTDGVVLVSDGATLRSFDAQTAVARDLRSDAPGLIACWLDARRPLIACVAEEDRLVLLDARSGATILDYKTKPEPGSSAWRIEPPPVNGAMVAMDAALNGFETLNVGAALDLYDALDPLDPEARRDWVRASLAHEAAR